MLLDFLSSTRDTHSPLDNRSEMTVEVDMEIEMNHDIGMSNAATTIDASVVQSKILQSASLMKEVDMDEGSDQPSFPQLSAIQQSQGKSEYRRVRCPPHRYTPLRDTWEQILTPLVEYLKLQVSITSFDLRMQSMQMRQLSNL